MCVYMYSVYIYTHTHYIYVYTYDYISKERYREHILVTTGSRE